MSTICSVTSGAGSIETIDDAIAAMDAEIDRCLDTKDPCGYFAIVYRAVTDRVRRGIAAGVFEDNERMEHFDVVFARRYLDSRAGWHARQPIPDSWRVAFEAGGRPRHLVLQHLLLGINAHINLDLGVAVASSTESGEIDPLRADFDLVNDVLAEMIDKMQDAIASTSPIARAVDLAALRFDEAFVTFSIRRARTDAWDFATELSRCPLNGREALERSRDLEVSRLGTRIVRPVRPVRWMVSAASYRERHDLDGVMRVIAT